MACRSVNSLRLSRDDMRRVYRDQARRRRGGVKIGHIIEILDILVPIIPHFFGQARVNASVDADNYSNRCSMGYSGADDMSFNGSAHCGMGSDRHGFGLASGKGNFEMARAEDYGDCVISEEEFERLLDCAEQHNVKMY